MLTNPSSLEIAARLALATLAGAAVGYDREIRGEAAGLRTTSLICVAAALAMVLSNELLSIGGQQVPQAFIRADVLRLPLGVLSGIGFIGAGAIVRRGDIVQGVTTAATIWLMTMIGLTFGAGELALGVIVTLGALAMLWAVKPIEGKLRSASCAMLTVLAEPARLTEADLRRVIEGSKQRVITWAVTYFEAGRVYEVRIELEWRARDEDRNRAPPFVQFLAEQPGVRQTDWSPRPTAT